jgi:hypothetical protein
VALASPIMLRVGALDPALTDKNLRMSAGTELTILCLVAAAAGGVALAADNLPFTIIFAAMSWVAFGHVLRHRDQ